MAAGRLGGRVQLKDGGAPVGGAEESPGGGRAAHAAPRRCALAHGGGCVGTSLHSFGLSGDGRGVGYDSPRRRSHMVRSTTGTRSERGFYLRALRERGVLRPAAALGAIRM